MVITPSLADYGSRWVRMLALTKLHRAELLAMDVVGGGAARNVVAEDGVEVQTCLYCANLKALRDLLPPKRCDYCRKWRCQFCTLKFPLLGVRKGLPKVLKGNSRICIQCFGQTWQESEGVSTDTTPRLRGDSNRPDTTQNRGRESRGVIFGGRSSTMIESRRRGSMVDSEATMGSSRRSSTIHSSMMGSSRRGSMMDSSRRGSMLESERRVSMMVDQVWAEADPFTDSRRFSFMDSSNDSDLAKRPIRSIARSSSEGLSYRVASFLGLVASDGSDGTSMNAAIGLWMSLFAASILLVIALADGFSVHQRLCYCVATYGIFLTLHPWIHADRQSSGNLGDAERTAKPAAVAPQTAPPVKRRRRRSSVVPESGSIPDEYKARIQEMNETLAYYLSDESPWKLVKATRGSEIYELTENKTPFAIFKIEVAISGISMDKFMAFLDSKDPRARSVWDFNEANFEVIETFDSSDFDDDADVSVCVNTQKPFLGGLVAPRDFCILNVARENSICFGSVDHPDVPARPGTTRGHIFFSCFYCKEDTSVPDPEGFSLTYICQTAVGGNLPVKLLYNGTMDTMAKMAKVFHQAKDLFPK